MTGRAKDPRWPEDAADLVQLLRFVVSVWMDRTLAPADVSARLSSPRTASPRRFGAEDLAAQSAVRGLEASPGLLGAAGARARSG